MALVLESPGESDEWKGQRWMKGEKSLALASSHPLKRCISHQGTPSMSMYLFSGPICKHVTRLSFDSLKSPRPVRPHPHNGEKDLRGDA